MLSELLAKADIEDFFSGAELSRGRAYQRNGRVTSHRIDDRSLTISASVRGSRPRPYRVDISLDARNGGLEDIEGHCSCPVAYNCKHVVAVLQEVLSSNTGPADPPALTRPALPLPHEIAAWLETLRNSERGDDYPAGVNQRLLYILKASGIGGRMPELFVSVSSVRVLKNGEFSTQETRVGLSNFNPDGAPKYFRDSDIAIVQRLSRVYGYHGEIGVRSTDLVQQMVATGRAFWSTRTEAPLRWGPPRDGHFEWRAANASHMGPDLRVPDALAVNAEPPVYVDQVNGIIGPVHTGVPDRTVYHLLSAPLIPRTQIMQVAHALGNTLPTDRPDLLPAHLEPPRRIEERPIPVLRLHRPRLPVFYGGQMQNFALAKLRFRYGPTFIDRDEKAATIDVFHDGNAFTVVRDPAAEKAAFKKLIDEGFAEVRRLNIYAAEADRLDFKLPDTRAWLNFLHFRAEALRLQGFEIEIDKDFPFRLAQNASAVDIDVVPSGTDWFDLSVGVDIDGKRHDITATLSELIRSGVEPGWLQDGDPDRPIYIHLNDGRYVPVAASRFVPLILSLHAVNPAGTAVKAGSRLRLSYAEAATVAGLAGEDIAFKGTDGLRRMAGLLRTDGLARVTPPPTFDATLRPYQLQGLAWLDLLRESGLGGILADDMGLGKTVQILALLATEKAAGRQTGPSLIVAPTSLMTNWCNEARRFAPDLSVLLLHGPDRRERFGEIARHDLVITTYPLIARDHETLLEQDWHMTVLDEAQTIKNPNAATTKWLRNIKTRHRFCLSGTPMENHLGELWSLMSFVNPGFLGDQKAFGRIWRNPIEKDADKFRAAALARRIKPFVLRRTKAEVAADLPARTDIVEIVELERGQRDLYDSIRLSMSEKVRKAIAERGLARSHIIVLEALLKLRQACCDPRLLKLDDGVVRPSAKLERLMEMIAELRSEGRRIIVFSQFTSMLALIRERCDAAGYDYSLLTGQTKDRRAAIEAFQGGQRTLFLISLKAGGVGLNLTAADTVILYDPWWNPAVEAQAVDRAHRIGQDKAVFVYRLQTSGTIEEKMVELKARKQALADGLFSADGEIGSALTEEDVTSLLDA